MYTSQKTKRRIWTFWKSCIILKFGIFFFFFFLNFIDFHYDSTTTAFVIFERFDGKYRTLGSLSVFSGCRHYLNIEIKTYFKIMIWPLILLETVVKFGFIKKVLKFVNPNLVPVEPKTANETSHHLMKSHNFEDAEGKDIACGPFYYRTGQVQNDHLQGKAVIWGRSKNNKIRQFNDRANFYPMLIVAPVTSRSNDVRSSHYHVQQR